MSGFWWRGKRLLVARTGKEFCSRSSEVSCFQKCPKYCDKGNFSRKCERVIRLIRASKDLSRQVYRLVPVLYVSIVQYRCDPLPK